MKGFYIEVKNDLLDPKHVRNMGEAVWLYMWLLDHVTSVNENGEGRVLGNKAITHADVQAELGISRITYWRWLGRLRDHSYINTLRSPNGLYFTVFKAKKRGFKFETSKVLKSDVSKTIHDPSDVSKSSSDVSKMNSDASKSSIHIKKTTQGLHKTTQPTVSDKPATMAREILQFYNHTFGQELLELPERLAKIKTRLRRYKPEQLACAITNASRTDWFTGGGARGWIGDLDYIIRNDANVEKFLAAPPKPKKARF